MQPQAWFETWFDTSYYHLLYRHRDESEAGRFMDALLQELSLPPGAKILDLGCGFGRHAHYLHTLGYDVTGIDLSERCIKTATEAIPDGPAFLVRDIRHPLGLPEHDLTLNLFTSFGYFDSLDEHICAAKNISGALKPGGMLVLDYLNTSFVKFHLVPREQIRVDAVDFSIRRSFEDGYIVKDITVSDRGTLHHYRERVMAFSRDDLYQILSTAGLKAEKCFGDYTLCPYDSGQPRVIIIARKTV